MTWITDKRNSGKFDVFAWHKYEIFVKANSRKFGYIALTHVNVFILNSDIIFSCVCDKYNAMLSLTLSLHVCFWHNFKSEKGKQVHDGIRRKFTGKQKKWYFTIFKEKFVRKCKGSVKQGNLILFWVKRDLKDFFQKSSQKKTA